MSLTATVTSQALAEWVRLFPKQVTETYTSSVTFMKQLTIVAISTISYLKNVFPEESYTVEQFGGVKLRILKKKCRDELAQFVSTALAQAFEAFEKKYLQKLALCFYDGECSVDNLIEYHMFEYSYTPAGVTMDVTSRNREGSNSSKFSFDNVREKTVQLIRACVVIMETCQNQLPSSYDVSLRLYYNEDAPEGYQAPGFVSAAEGTDHLEHTAGGAVRLGTVRTPHHRLQASSYLREALGSSHEAQASQNVPMMTQNEGDDFNDEDVSIESAAAGGAVRVRCPCGKQDLDGEPMLICEWCGTAAHAACFGRRGARAAHCCTRCSDADPRRKPADPRLALLPHKRECLCILRRTLVWCSKRDAVAVPGLVERFALSHVNAAKLMKLLQSYGVVEDTDTDIMSPRKIMPEQLSSVMSKYFEPEESDMVDRLLAETLSQGSQADPVGEVLGPLEKVSLQNATNLGKVIEPPQDCAKEDATLKQYKEVILSNQQTEELPLSGNHNPIKDMRTIGKRNGKRKADKENVRSGVRTKRARANN